MRKHNSLLLLTMLSLLWLASCTHHSPRFRIGVSQCSDDEWRHQMNNEILREALFYDGVEVDIRTVKDDNIRQIEDIRRFIKEEVDLLIVAPNEAAPITPVVEEVFDSGIPVIVIDRKILSDKYTAYIGADNYEIGKAVGHYVTDMLRGQGTVLELTGLAGSTPAIDRHQGFASIITTHPGIRLLAQEDAAWLRSVAEQKTDTLLRCFPQIDVIYAQNDRMAAGAYTAAAREGRAKDIRFVGIDALSGKGYGVEQVLEGKLDATFIYPTGGDRVMQIAMDILNKREFPRETLLKTSVVDSTNAPVMQMQTAHIATLDGKIEMINGKMNQYLSRFGTQQVVLYGSLLILLLVAGLLVVVYKSLRSKNRLNAELSNQKTQLEEQRDRLMQLSHQLEEATHAKLVFFTNISHDFRTPLTLVADPVEQLLADKNLTADQQQLLQLVQRNVNILLRLVNQILDFRTFENGKMEFVPVSLDLLSCFESWNDSFLAAARKKYIRFSFEYTPDAEYQMLADKEKLERIYFNLLSNAFKFTPANGKISVRLSAFSKDGQAFLRFTVSNTGSLISSEHIRSIFDRFYKIDRDHAGSGIGLALVKAFVEMHGGTIEVESDEKRGTVFTVDLPVMNNADFVIPKSPEIGAELPFASSEVAFDLFDEGEEQEKEKYDSSRQTILIIDDNADIRTYVRSLLSANYSVIDAADGSEGICKAMKYIPDLIISDVMMPGIDGIECCRRLKSEVQTCHIPVVLLTACSLDEQRIQGYDGGADSYISKPFNSQLLLSRIHNLIDSRRQLRQFFGDNQVLAKENICDLDKDFVSRFKSLVEENMKDSELNIEDLGRDMGMSRVQLYRKLKSLTNYSPNELLRQMRLKKASSLLSSSHLTIAEIAYEVGFSSPSYFTKCYKEQYGEIPTDFLKRRR